jgi:hypothetical protein
LDRKGQPSPTPVSLLYFDTLRTLRVFFHAEPNDFGKGLVRVWAIRPLTGQSEVDTSGEDRPPRP